MRLGKIALLGSVLAIAGFLGWKYADGRIATLLAINTKSGKLNWVQPVNRDFSFSRGAIAADGKVLLNFCTRSSQKNCDRAILQALEARSGKLLWSYQPNLNRDSDFNAYELVANPFIAWQHNQLYIQVQDKLISLNPTTGQQRWAIERPWWTAQGVNYGLGLATRPNGLTILRRNQRQRIIQSLNPQTGAVVKQFTFSLPELTTTRDLIVSSDRHIFLETATLTPSGSGSYFDTGESTITAYDLQSANLQFRRAIFGSIEGMQAVNNRFYVNTFNNTAYKSNSSSVAQDSALISLDELGRVQWQKPKKQFNCASGNQWLVKADVIYLGCGQDKSSHVVALATTTGQLKGQVQTNAKNYSKNLPIAIDGNTLLTFSKQVDLRHATQVVGLDRTTGKLLWKFSVFDDQFINSFRSIVATDSESLFVLDKLPRWQLWLLDGNLNWWLNQK